MRFRLENGIRSHLEVACLGQRDSVVPVEVVVVVHVGFHAVQVDVNVLELLEQEEATGHALSAGNCVALAGTRSNELEKSLGVAQILRRAK